VKLADRRTEKYAAEKVCYKIEVVRLRPASDFLPSCRRVILLTTLQRSGPSEGITCLSISYSNFLVVLPYTQLTTVTSDSKAVSPTFCPIF